MLHFLSNFHAKNLFTNKYFISKKGNNKIKDIQRNLFQRTLKVIISFIYN